MSILKSDIDKLTSHGLLIKRNQRLSENELIELSHQIGNGPLEWDFGPIMNMQLDPQAQNYLFSKQEVPLHWDGAFFREPRFLIFYCLESSGEGGETIFCDTQKVLKEMSKEKIQRLKKINVTYETQKKAHYGGSFKSPLIKKIDTFYTLRFAQKVETKLNPVQMTFEGLTSKDSQKLYNEINSLVTNEKVRTIHQWAANDLVIVDNRKFLHGRNALKNNINRRFKRVQAL